MSLSGMSLASGRAEAGGVNGLTERDNTEIVRLTRNRQKIVKISVILMRKVHKEVLKFNKETMRSNINKMNISKNHYNQDS
mgnify:CR=1 FL=1